MAAAAGGALAAVLGRDRHAHLWRTPAGLGGLARCSDDDLGEIYEAGAGAFHWRPRMNRSPKWLARDMQNGAELSEAGRWSS